MATAHLQNGHDTQAEPSLLEQTLELATILKKISDRDPEGPPTVQAASVFRSWLATARNFTEEPQYFDDVTENYDVTGRSNRDLFDMFELLHPYVEIVDDREFPEDEPPDGADIYQPADTVGRRSLRTYLIIPTEVEESLRP